MQKYLLKLATISMLLICLPLMADERHIHVNGEHLDADTIQSMDQIFGQYVPDNYYWMNFETGQWGFEGEAQVQGVFATVDQQPADTVDYQPTVINNSQNGSYVSGRVNGQNCSYVSVAGTTLRSCD